MQRILTIIFICAGLISCGTTRKPRGKNNNTTTTAYKQAVPKWDRSEYRERSSAEEITTEKEEPITGEKKLGIIEYALNFQGTPYKFGGNTEKGMDCSGLVHHVFRREDVDLPRVSRDMAKEGIPVKDDEIQVGDLLFFITGRGSKNINHVGLVVDILPGQILFIHSTNSRGVIISSLNEGYWNNSYRHARRII